VLFWDPSHPGIADDELPMYADAVAATTIERTCTQLLLFATKGQGFSVWTAENTSAAGLTSPWTPPTTVTETATD
jgi:hypothetical protein